MGGTAGHRDNLEFNQVQIDTIYIQYCLSFTSDMEFVFRRKAISIYWALLFFISIVLQIKFKFVLNVLLSLWQGDCVMPHAECCLSSQKGKSGGESRSEAFDDITIIIKYSPFVVI